MRTLNRLLSVALLAAVAAASALWAAGAHAQTLKVATGSAKLTYSTLFKEMTQFCGTSVSMTEVNSGGSMDNIDRLVGNEVNAGFVQSDVLWLRARTEDLSNVKTLLALHNEQIHLIARAGAGVKTGGVMGLGGKVHEFTDLASLAGQTIAAAGGSAVTAQVIRLQSEVPFTVLQKANNDEVLKALANGEASAALIVAGAPTPLVANLGPDFKLLAISGAVAERLKGVYRPARLSYSKMGAAGVPTVATDALFVTREYKTERMTSALGSFRGCVQSKLDEIKETTGTHPAWQAVVADNKGKWVWYDLPSAKK